MKLLLVLVFGRTTFFFEKGQSTYIMKNRSLMYHFTPRFFQFVIFFKIEKIALYFYLKHFTDKIDFWRIKIFF